MQGVEWAWRPERDGTKAGKELSRRTKYHDRDPRTKEVIGSDYARSKQRKHAIAAQLARFEEMFQKSTGRSVR